MISKKAMENGDLLRHLIEHFYEEQSQLNITALLTCLRDSDVYVPINISEKEDASGMEMRPDLLLSNGELFFPAFSNPEQMGDEYGSRFSKVKMSFLNVITSAAEDIRIKGIVVDAFTRYFVVGREQYDLVLSLPTNVIDEGSL